MRFSRDGKKPHISRDGIYLREGAEYVGPFYSREDAERFLVLMEFCGESREGIEIVKMDNAAASARLPEKKGKEHGGGEQTKA